MFYSLYVINGSQLMQWTGASGVLAAVRAQGGVFVFGRPVPIWAVVLIEFAFAYTLEVLLGSPFSFRLACRQMAPQETKPFVFELLIISDTVLIMCPAMSFIAAWLYYPYMTGFSVWTLFANWLKLVCFNFPFALLSQIFFIQPVVRRLFGLCMKLKKPAAAPAQQAV